MKHMPKFLFAENLNGDRYFVICCQKPRCIIEFIENAEGYENGTVVEWIDHPEADVIKIAQLMREAGEFLVKYDEILKGY